MDQNTVHQYLTIKSTDMVEKNSENEFEEEPEIEAEECF